MAKPVQRVERDVKRLRRDVEAALGRAGVAEAVQPVDDVLRPPSVGVCWSRGGVSREVTAFHPTPGHDTGELT